MQAPIRPLHFAQLLETHPSPQFVNTLLSQLQYGFDIGYQETHQDLRALNLPYAAEHPQAIDDYLALGCSQEKMAGPFSNPPYQPFHCSGMGVVLKQDGPYRLITHLSAPPGQSINDDIDPEAVTLAYTSVDDIDPEDIDPEAVTLAYTSVDEAIRLANALGRGTLFAKIDLKSAFRQCPVRAADWHLLGLHWRGQYYYDKCLPYGLRLSPFLFNTVAVALAYVIRLHLGNPTLIHYLDDFLFAGPPDSAECERTLNGAELLCDRLGIETKRAKCTLPSTCITLVGVELDTVARTARVPPAKLSLLMQELSAFQKQRKYTKLELFSLIGKVAFAAKVIPAGRIFLRHLIDASTTVPLLHHHLRVSAGIMVYIDWWLAFATDWNGKAFFHNHEWLPSPQFQLYTDASQLGYVCYWRGHWFCGLWDRKQLSQDIQ